MARPRKPRAFVELEGDRSHRPPRQDMPVLGDPMPSPALSADQQRIWWNVVDNLPAGFLSKVDELLLDRLAVVIDRMVTLSEKLQAQGLMIRDADGLVRRHPLLIVERQCADEFHRLAGELGLSPLARTRLATIAKSPAPDPLESLLQHWEGAAGSRR